CLSIHFLLKNKNAKKILERIVIMRFNWMRISSIIVCVLVFSACGNDEENEDIDLEKEAEEISVEFLDTLYNVEESHFVDENDTVEEVADYFEQQVDEYEVY